MHQRWVHTGLPPRQLFECPFIDHVHGCCSSLGTGGLLVLHITHPALDLERVTQYFLFVGHITRFLHTRHVTRARQLQVERARRAWLLKFEILYTHPGRSSLHDNLSWMQLVCYFTNSPRACTGAQVNQRVQRSVDSSETRPLQQLFNALDWLQRLRSATVHREIS